LSTGFRWVLVNIMTDRLNGSHLKLMLLILWMWDSYGSLVSISSVSFAQENCEKPALGRSFTLRGCRIGGRTYIFPPCFGVLYIAPSYYVEGTEPLILRYTSLW
jgi:hypothetical protein